MVIFSPKVSATYKLGTGSCRLCANEGQVMQAYQWGFVVLFGILLVSSLGITLAFSWVPEQRLDRTSNPAEYSDMVVEMDNLIDDEETNDGL